MKKLFLFLYATKVGADYVKMIEVYLINVKRYKNPDFRSNEAYSNIGDTPESHPMIDFAKNLFILNLLIN